MTDRAWKQFERRVARAHGCERTPVSGRQQDAGGLDWENPLLAGQCKLGYDVPAYLRGWLGDIVRHATARGKIGLVIWKPKRAKDKDALVILRLEDWLALHGAP